MTQSSCKLAMIADWLPTYGGAEHVIAALQSVWSDSPIFTSVARPGALGPLERADIRTDAFLQRIFRLIGRHQYLLPWMPRSFESIDCSGFDVILSSSHAVAKGVIPSSHSVHVCYCHTPMRYAWEMEDEYLSDFRIRGILKWFVRSELKRLRRWDQTTAKRVDHFIANSGETQERIKRIYGRDSVVVHPPVDARFFDFPLTPTFAKDMVGKPSPRPYFLAIGRLVPYKRFDLLIELCNKSSLPLKIVGTGSDLARLRRLAGGTVEFLGHVPDADLPSLYAGANCLLFPQVEDAGIVPLEAQACGIPVIAYDKGGVRDVLVDDVTGVLVSEQSVSAFADGIQKFQRQRWDPETIRTHAKKFHIDVFKEKMKKEVESAGRKYRAGVPACGSAGSARGVQ
ncbi:glycosyltransferase family 4 protein [Candidatus Peribacteria bacterium]|nr:glycosyltransferase family 4 protein [Candidatus Peribacteria bacterium]